MTENRDGRDEAPTMQDVDHTHPHTDRTFGGNFTFARGGVVAADGGRPDVVPENGVELPAEEDDADSETLRDVDHTPPNGSQDANRVFARGSERAAREEDRPGTDARGGDDGRPVDHE